MKIIDNTTNGQFEARIGEHLAYMTYRLRDEKVFLLHTEVPAVLGGQGVGSALVQHAAAYAREKNLTLVPYCPFARGYLEKHPDLLPGV